jgi:PAS domain-containing protein
MALARKQGLSFFSLFTGRASRHTVSRQPMRSLEETGPTDGGETQHATTLIDTKSPKQLSRRGGAGDDSSRNAVGAGSPLAQRAWQPEQQDIRRERLDLIHRLAPSSLLSGFVAALTFLALSWDTPRFMTMLWWFCGAMIGMLFRVFNLWHGRQYAEQRDPNLDKWEFEQTLGALVAGLIWGSLFVFVPPFDQLGTFLYLALLMVVLMVSVPMFSALMPAMWAMTVPSALGGLYLIATNPFTQSPVLWVLACVFALMVYASLNTYRHLINENVKYRLMNARLTAEMMVTLEDPSAGVLRVLKGDVRYANERMSELTGLAVDTVMRSPLSSLMGPGPWSDPNWTQLKQALAHGLPQTFNWWLPHSNGEHKAVRIRTRGVWDFSQSHGGVMLFSPLSPAPLFSNSIASESLPILVASPEEWLTYARADRRKRSANPVMVAVVRPSPGTDFEAWRREHEGQLLRRMSAREMICFDTGPGGPSVYLWLSATVRDLTPDQVRAALINSLTQGAMQSSVAAVSEMAQLELGDGAELARLRHGATLQVGVARTDHETDPDEALERAQADAQTFREARASTTSKPKDSMHSSAK